MARRRDPARLCLTSGGSTQSSRFRYLTLTLIIGLVLLSSLSSAPPASAATITVTTTTDELNADGDCSLREAIQAANADTAVSGCIAGSGADTINVPAGVYTMTIPGTNEDANLTGDLDLTSNMTINGATASSTIIQACDSSSGPCIGIDRALHSQHLVGPAVINISRVTVRNASERGGIRNETNTTLNLSDSVVTANSDGGIFDYGGSLHVMSSHIDGNSGNTQSTGAGITSAGAADTLTDSTVGGNLAGGVSTSNDMTITDSTISNNTAEGAAGLDIGAGAVVTVFNSTISDNGATRTEPFLGFGGGISNHGALSLNSSTVRGNTASSGAGIYNHIASLTVSNSTINDNDARFSGGGIYNYVGTMDVSNTITANGASASGGGIYDDGQSFSTTNSTLAGNSAASGGGIFVNGTPPTMKNTIVANSPSGGDCANVGIASLGHNLSSDTTCGFASSGDLNNTGPLLGPLADNGGLTETHALLPGSPAIDAGSPDSPPPATDQRGVLRPQDGDGNSTAVCDIGAFEAAGASGPVAGISFEPPPRKAPTFDQRWLLLILVPLAAAGASVLRFSRTRIR